jgi:hypothetical protein
MPPVGFEPEIPVSRRPQTHALDRAATGIGTYNFNCSYKIIIIAAASNPLHRAAFPRFFEFGFHRIETGPTASDAACSSFAFKLEHVTIS